MAAPLRRQGVSAAGAFVSIKNLSGPPPGVVIDKGPDTFIPVNLEKWVDVDTYFKYEKMIPVRLKRGCPFRCSYCNYNALEGQGGSMDLGARLEGFLRGWIDRGACVDIVDSVFNAPESHAIGVLRWLRERRLTGNYHASAFIPVVKNKEIFEAMETAGMGHGMIGMDGGCDEMLESYNKPFRVGQVEKFLKARAGWDLSFLWTFIVGGPCETEKTIEKTMRFIENLPTSDMAYVTLGARVYPGTTLHELARAETANHENTSPLEPAYYFSSLVDQSRAAEKLHRWAAGMDNVLLSSDSYRPEYQLAFERFGAFQSNSPGWKNIPVFKKMMKRSRRPSASTG